MKITERTEIIVETTAYYLPDFNGGINNLLAHAAEEIAICVKSIHDTGVPVTSIRWSNTYDKDTNPDLNIGHFEVRGERVLGKYLEGAGLAPEQQEIK